ncbi:hypothetical protein ACIBFB_26590 [Nocardiopsis sp. NPDC050513]|uniref:hypothetical protein n=1 Tax=Nocardiopsis sp. NPDC050513 TaxID=3364338 RepID=UPI0037AC6377
MEQTTQRRRGNRRQGVRRDNFVKLSLSDDEHELLTRAAKDQAMTLSGFAAHAALGVARHTLDVTPDARETLVALNDAVTALERLHADLRASTDPEGLARVVATIVRAVEALENAGDAVADAHR